MPQNQVPESVHAAFTELSQRCDELGMWLWLCGPAGKLLQSPEDTPIDPGLVEAAAMAMAAVDVPIPMELSPGRWLIPIDHRLGSRRIAMYLALLPTSEPQDVTRIATMLRWAHDEITRGQNDEITIEQFSEKLAQAYEETNLLYRMARLLNCGTEATDAIRTIGSQLQEVLPFNWLAIRFSPNSRGLKDLAGKLIVAGEPPCEEQTLSGLTDPLLACPTKQGWKKVLSPDKDDLARVAGAEVLAEPITLDDRVIGVLIAGNKRGPDPSLSSVEIQFLDATADFLSVFHENLSRFNEQQEMFIGTLQALTASIDAKDPYTMGHSQRVGLMASKMAVALGLEKTVVEHFRIAGLVHDVGKIGVPEAVLTKPSRLSDDEFELIKLHPNIGHRILNQIPSLGPVLPGVLWHHERWDGRGYPDGIKGEEIPLIARVLALSDTFDAMSSNRAYRPALSRQRVLEELRKNGGSQFDPKLADLFITLDFREFDEVLRATQSVAHKAA